MIEIEAPDGTIVEFPEGTNDETIKSVMAKNYGRKPTEDSSFSSAITKGAADVLGGFGTTLRHFGAPEAGAAIAGQGRALAPKAYKPAFDGVMNPKPGDAKLFGYGTGYIPRAAVEALPGLATDIAAGHVGQIAGGGIGALTGPFAPVAIPAGMAVGRVGGTLASYFARSLGERTEEAASKRTGLPDAEPTTRDKAVGAATVLPEALLNTFAAGRFVKPERIVGVGAEGIGNAMKSAIKTAGLEGTTNAAQDAIAQAGTSFDAPGGMEISDPRRVGAAGLIGAASGGTLASAKLSRDAATALRFRNFGGDDTGASASVANRLLERVGSARDLSNPKAAFTAVADVSADVHTELTAATRELKKAGALTPEATNAIERAKAGRVLTETDISAIDAVPDSAAVAALVRQASAVAKLKDLGAFDRSRKTFTGGATERIRRVAMGHPFAVGGIATGLAHTAGSGAAPIAGAALGTYAAARAAEKALGITAPARTFAEKFADPAVPVRTHAPKASRVIPLPQRKQRTPIEDVAALTRTARHTRNHQRVDEVEVPEGLLHTKVGPSDLAIAAKAADEFRTSGDVPEVVVGRYLQSAAYRQARIRDRFMALSGDPRFPADDLELGAKLDKIRSVRTRHELATYVDDITRNLPVDAATAIRAYFGPEWAKSVWVRPLRQ